MTKLLIALDCDHDKACKIYTDALNLHNHPNFGGFKFSLSFLLKPHSNDLLRNCRVFKVPFMLDFKLYNTPEEVQRCVKWAEEMGAEWITIHVASISAAIQTAKQIKIVAVDKLTTSALRSGHITPDFAPAFGLVCHPCFTHYFRYIYPNKTIFCPGIRDYTEAPNTHIYPETIERAVENGADYVITGRPIYDSYLPIEKLAEFLSRLERA